MEKLTRLVSCSICGKDVLLDMTSYNELDADWQKKLGGILKRVSCEDCCASDKRERRKRMARHRLGKTGIPEPFIKWDRTLGNNPMIEWVWKNRKKSMFITDDYGAGKTRAVCATGAVESQDQWVLFFRTVDLLKTISGLYGSSMVDCRQFIETLKRCDILILDDFGKEKLTDRAGESVFDVIDSRYTHSKPVWITTNLNGQEMITKLGEDRGKAVVRRLSEMCEQWIPTEVGE